jgi:hypothetical protein
MRGMFLTSKLDAVRAGELISVAVVVTHVTAGYRSSSVSRHRDCCSEQPQTYRKSEA